MAIFNFRAIGPVFIASVGNYSVNIYNDAYTPIDTADMNQINVLGISRGIYYNLLECDDPTGFADFSEGFSGIHKEIVSGIKLKLGGADVGSSNPLPVNIIGGGNDLSVLIIEDSTGTKYLRREVIDESGVITISYENFDGSAAIPIAPITVTSMVLPIGASTSAKQDTAQSTLDAIDIKLGGTIAVSNVATENHLGEIGGRTVRVAATFARPGDSAPYGALDTVSTSTSAPVVITFSGMARINAGSGYITKARIMTDQKTNSARFRLHLFHTAPTLTNDNAAFPLLWADRANRVGKIDFGAMTTEDATNSTCAESLNEAVRLSFTCEAANTALYGILETLDAFTPASGQNFYISLTSEQN